MELELGMVEANHPAGIRIVSKCSGNIVRVVLSGASDRLARLRLLVVNPPSAQPLNDPFALPSWIGFLRIEPV